MKYKIKIMTKTETKNLYQSKTPKVYKNNKLNTANFGDFNNTDYQVLLYLITKIGGVDEYGKYLQPNKLEREHTITAKDFSNEFNVDISNSYRFLYKVCRKLMKTSIFLEKIDSQKLREINVCSSAEYNKKEGKITIQFTDTIMPYLAQVKEKFLIYNLKEISNFKSLYTTRLYEAIQEFKETGYMVKSINELRNLFSAENKFKKYYDFKKRTFRHACNEINSNYEISLGFEEIKKGREIVAIKFVFNKTKVHKGFNPKTKKEKNIYQKPKKKVVEKRSTQKTSTKENDIKINETIEISKHKTQEPKPIKNILSRLFSNLKK